MANPNIVAVTSIYGKTAVQDITTSATAIVTNSASSGEVYKVGSLIVSNIDGTVAADVTVDLLRGGSSYKIVSTVSVPANATLVVIAKDTGIYLEEGDSLRCLASAAGDLQAVCSYETIN